MLTGQSARRLRGDRGSSLMLMPAAVLIIIVLGAIAADFSHIHNRKRELIAVANSIANDAVTYGINMDELRQNPGQATPFDNDRIREVVNRSIELHRQPDRPISYVSHTTDPATSTVTVTLADEVDYIFGRAIPGVSSTRIEFTGSATAEED